MVSQVTQGIRVSVITNFEGKFFKDYRMRFAFTYRITIENQSKDSVQLLSRYWNIFDSLNDKKTIFGQGVVGQKPIIKSGQSYTYSSGCMLVSSLGAMKGYFTMVNFTTTKKFKVTVPAFRLGAPYALN